MEPDELTRRLWLIRIGGASVLSGLPGLEAEGASQTELPAGLYLPSADHLAHVLKPVAAVETPAAPQFFSAAEYQQIKALVSRMLGEDPDKPPIPEITAWIDLVVYDAAAVREAARSLSPADRAVAAGFYGEETVHEIETFDVQQVCREGLAQLKVDSLKTLESLEAAGDPFVRWLKRRVIEGFYTSQAGLKELDYKGNSFYSVSPGCDS